MNFTEALFEAADNCNDRTSVTKAVEKLFHSVLPVYEGSRTSMRDAVVTFFYRLSVHYIQSTVGTLTPLSAPELTGQRDYNFKLCVANWGHHRHFRQNNSNLMAIACCLDKFILLSKRIADSLFSLSTIVAEVKSNLMHICPPCKTAFLQNMICHRCNRYPMLDSCPSQATDLVHKCFPGVVALNCAWNEVLDSIDELIKATSSFNGICSCMTSLQTSLKAYCPPLGTQRRKPGWYPPDEQLRNTQALVTSVSLKCNALLLCSQPFGSLSSWLLTVPTQG